MAKNGWKITLGVLWTIVVLIIGGVAFSIYLISKGVLEMNKNKMITGIITVSAATLFAFGTTMSVSDTKEQIPIHPPVGFDEQQIPIHPPIGFNEQQIPIHPPVGSETQQIPIHPPVG